jgi:tRNA threonylcarbamoyladenosine biosynthesis protein TsaE
MTTSLTTHSPQETLAFAESMATALRPPATIALYGDLGSGKTCFVKGLVRGLGSEDLVTSPTFTLVHHYIAPSGKVRHFDLYRIKSDGELDDLEINGGPGEIVLVEWPEVMEKLLPDNAIRIKFELVPEKADDRKITVEFREQNSEPRTQNPE